MYMTTPTMHTRPSASDVMPIAPFSSTPARIWPPVTRGPYPPPLIPLLNAATSPRPTTFFHEKAKVLPMVARMPMPMTSTSTPMYVLIAHLGTFTAMTTAMSVPTTLHAARTSATLSARDPRLKLTLPTSWWSTPARTPVRNSESSTEGTICAGSYPIRSSRGVRVVPYPIPSVESTYSQARASRAMVQRIWIDMFSPFLCMLQYS